MYKKLIGFIFVVFFLTSCGDKPRLHIAQGPPEKPFELTEFGFRLDDYLVKRDTIKSGDSFGEILNRHNIGHGKIFEIVQKTKDSFNSRRLRAGKPYTLLLSKDSLQQPQHFIYQPNTVDYVVVNLTDSIHAYKDRKPVTIVEREISGVIAKGGSLSRTLYEAGANNLLVPMENIYQWTISFHKLQPGDRFKVLYTEKYVDDTTLVDNNSIEVVRAACFEHGGKSIYAFAFENDTINHTSEYFDEFGKSLRGAFLKAPVRYSKVSSRYNLTRKIAYYGYKVRPHRGTDFAAPIGSEILATANGTVVESARRGGNGNYVKIKHNSTYSTQYLHMRERKVKVGDYVRQGDVIGWVGMTGNTAGPHVCYRFWKNGSQVDPFLEQLPESEDPIHFTLRAKFDAHIAPLKAKLDSLLYTENTEQTEQENSIALY